ncbi:TetR/AcrR family transcriptional regulator [Kibdelosporangium phytohabitans]|uniref:TetR family transcriptional regulator n=1 Tax=Kibdelosporangium phytohabitans TaxID=860235 RepID=A0A0N9HUM9_9PSEU|nr:TetR/AcrR family transcriptional regulator [Kibdelosporangium phytohabitans]ALG08915.1 TetR family transcriptional regulator [Kibdelosporangium phytohabitans]MBE1469925.1 AcrR family transcriptional regulator [Kibdelosporangium phytohabitans]
MATTGARRGIYAGRSTEQRRAERRGKLVDAAFEIWGDQGWSAVSMRGVCARAALTDRYFYESFADVDALLTAVWERVRDNAIQRVVEAALHAPSDPIERLRAALAVFVHDLTEDPRLGRIGFGDHTGNAVLERLRKEALQQFTDLLIELGQPYLRRDIDPIDFRMSVLLGIGGFIELVTAWLGGAIEVDADRIVDHTTTLGADMAARYLAQPAT